MLNQSAIMPSVTLKTSMPSRFARSARITAFAHRGRPLPGSNRSTWSTSRGSPRGQLDRGQQRRSGRTEQTGVVHRDGSGDRVAGAATVQHQVNDASVRRAGTDRHDQPEPVRDEFRVRVVDQVTGSDAETVTVGAAVDERRALDAYARLEDRRRVNGFDVVPLSPRPDDARVRREVAEARRSRVLYAATVQPDRGKVDHAVFADDIEEVVRDLRRRTPAASGHKDIFVGRGLQNVVHVLGRGVLIQRERELTFERGHRVLIRVAGAGDRKRLRTLVERLRQFGDVLQFDRPA